MQNIKVLLQKQVLIFILSYFERKTIDLAVYTSWEVPLLEGKLTLKINCNIFL